MTNEERDILLNMDTLSLYYLKKYCPIRTGNMLHHIKDKSMETGYKITIKAYKYDEHIYNYSLKKRKQVLSKHSYGYNIKNLEKIDKRFTTYYGKGFDYNRKYTPKGIAQRLRFTAHCDFNYASHTNDAETRNKGWAYNALHMAVLEYCVKYNGVIEKWNLQ